MSEVWSNVCDGCGQSQGNCQCAKLESERKEAHDEAVARLVEAAKSILWERENGVNYATTTDKLRATLTDSEAMLAAIRGLPTDDWDTRQACLADDAPRLIYADWLSENGDEARAEFIRVQCELDDLGIGCTYYEGHNHDWEVAPNGKQTGRCLRCMRREPLRSRERELWHQLPIANLFVPWSSAVAINHSATEFSVAVGSSRIDCVVRRGFLSHVTLPMVSWVGRECERCYLGNNCPLCKEFGHLQNHMTCYECDNCSGTGRVGALGPAIVRSPVSAVEVVTFSDIMIHPSGGNSTFYVGNLGSWPREFWSKLKNLPTRSAALAAASRAAIEWVREN